MQRQHQTLTMGVLAALCVFALFFGMRAVTAPVPDQSLVADPEPACETRQISAGTKVGPQEVTVSVYNASGRAGMASKTMQELIERGFAPGNSGNVKAPEVAFVQVWTDSKDNPAAELVAKQFGPATKIVTDKTLPGIGVVVVIGPKIQPMPKDAPASVTAQSAASFCSPPVT
ncbi:LytR C-terminal domain-containing protein [Nocardioides daejeonensis]|uniref:LytR C-terminal domain-containing protein n=1 Tax=Nocardioides daejeonensis TaxID=1046556 RepID=UPI000D7485E6|nr:LytR C-terminal domain-containing protein [Nocardioides daejeonensis]